MSTTNTQIPMPAELLNLKPPTRADAIEHLRTSYSYGPKQPERFEDTKRGQECAGSKWNQDYCVAEREKFNRLREQGIESSLIALEREYERKVAEKQRIEAHNAAVLEAETATLRQRYMESPGATEADFLNALPELLEAQRRQAALTGQSEQERMVDEMRPFISI